MIGNIVILVLLFVTGGGGWKAVPANQALYALRQSFIPNQRILPDEELPRTYIHSIYKFGWCAPDVTTHQFFKKQANLSTITWQDHQATYVYLLEHMHSIRYQLQCIKMTSWVARKFLFHRSRLPMYYCQGMLFIMMLNYVQRFSIHEFYLHVKLNIPITFQFDFYQPSIL